tara:strand:+ start:1047 stop:1685 length:639 start_codon:yes stop_codon:yes gene_type:complete
MKKHSHLVRSEDKKHGRRYLFLLSIVLLFNVSCKNQEGKQKVATPKISHVHSQETFSKIMLPHLKQSGRLYRKYKNVYARKAVKGEKIRTITGDGLETSNTAKEGDFVIKNQTDAQEMYIVGNKKFNQRYRLLGEAKDEFSEYKPIGKAIGLELTSSLLTELGLETEFQFIAPWGEKMAAKKGDYIVCPPEFNQVYRIARKEFFETYELDRK